MKNKIKIIVSTLLTIALFFSLAACGKSIPSEVKPRKNNDAVSVALNSTFRHEIGCRAEKYDMHITLDTEKNTVYGYENVTIKNTGKDPLNKIGLRYFATAMTPDSKIKSVSEAGSSIELPLSLAVENTAVYADIASNPLKSNEERTFRVDFMTVIPEASDRFGFQRQDNGKMFILTFWAPQLAMLENGEWNETPYYAEGESTYNQMSNYFVELKAPKDYVIAASGDQETDGTVTKIIAENVREMAIMASNYVEKETKTIDGVKVNIYRDNVKGHQKRISVMLDAAVEAIGLYNKQIGKYIYGELDIVPAVLAEFCGGMEMPGLIIETLSDESFLTGGYSQDAYVVAHEVAHQWYCYAIGNDQYNEAWIDESFADFISYYFFGNHSKVLKKAQKADEKEQNASFCPLTDEGVYEESMSKMYINCPVDLYKTGDCYAEGVYLHGREFLNNLCSLMRDEFYDMMREWYDLNNGKVAHSADFIKLVMNYNSSNEVKNLINEHISAEHLK